MRCEKCQRFCKVQQFGEGYVCVCYGCQIIVYNSTKKPEVTDEK